MSKIKFNSENEATLTNEDENSFLNETASYVTTDDSLKFKLKTILGVINQFICFSIILGHKLNIGAYHEKKYNDWLYNTITCKLQS